MDFTDTSQRMGEQGARDFAVHGRHLFAEPLNPRAAARLPTEIRAARRFDASPFLSEQAFDANPQHTDANPRPGRNLLSRFENRPGFVEDAPPIVVALNILLGPGYRGPRRKRLKHNTVNQA